MSRPTLAQARAQYVHRYTLQHVPSWAQARTPGGTYYAPQYRTDAEWYENTTFPGEPGHLMGPNHCHSRNPSWPMGKVLEVPPTPERVRQAQKVLESEWRAQA